MRAPSGAGLLAVAVLIAGTSPALATQTARLSVSLTPERLGQGTTIGFDFTVAAPDGRVPSPLTALNLSYPLNVGLITSGLGIATCSPATLELFGAEGCPANSLMGHGSALIEIPLGPEIIHEKGQITTWMGPLQDGHIGLLLYASGEDPIVAQLIFSSVVVEDAPPFGGTLDTSIPLIPTLPEAPYAAVVHVQIAIGSQDITYYSHLHGKRISYRPIGLRLPHTCPHGGFPFAATFAFLDGTHATTSTAVPCPAKTRRR